MTRARFVRARSLRGQEALAAGIITGREKRQLDFLAMAYQASVWNRLAKEHAEYIDRKFDEEWLGLPPRVAQGADDHAEQPTTHDDPAEDEQGLEEQHGAEHSA